MSSRGISKKNEQLLREVLFKAEGRIIPLKEPQKKVKKTTGKRGRPIERINRPIKSAAKRTNPGEERYLITMKSEQIQNMKDIAAIKGIKIKDAFEQAVSEYINKIKKHPVKSASRVKP